MLADPRRGAHQEPMQGTSPLTLTSLEPELGGTAAAQRRVNLQAVSLVLCWIRPQPQASKVKSEVAQSCPTLCDHMTVAYQAPLSMGFPRQESWSGLPFTNVRWVIKKRCRKPIEIHAGGLGLASFSQKGRSRVGQKTRHPETHTDVEPERQEKYITPAHSWSN